MHEFQNTAAKGTSLIKSFTLLEIFCGAGCFITLVWFAWTTRSIYFLGDDLRYLYEIQNHSSTLSGMVSYVVNQLGTSFVWRPFINASWLLDSWMFGSHPWPYHLENIFLFAACAVFLYMIARRCANRSCAAVSTLLFVVMPFHYEVIAWISGRTDLWALFFSLFSLVAYIQFRDTARGYFFILSAFSYLLALFSKEFAIVTPVIIFLYDFFFLTSVHGWALLRKPTKGIFLAANKTRVDDKEVPLVGFRNEVFTRYLWYLVIAALYLALRFVALHSFISSDEAAANNFHFIPTLHDIKIIVDRFTIFFNMETLKELLPIPALLWERWKNLFILALLTGLTVLRTRALVQEKLWKPVLFAASMILFFSMPVLSLLPFITQNLKHSRFLLAPSVGVALLLAALLWPSEKNTVHPVLRAARGAILGVFITASVVGLWINILPWHAASALEHRTLDALKAFPEIVASSAPVSVYIQSTIGDVRDTYAFHDYYSFAQGVRMQYPNPNITIKSVGILPVPEPEFCASPLDRSRTFFLRWRGDHFITRSDVFDSWEHTTALPPLGFSTIEEFQKNGWEAHDMSIEAADDGVVLTPTGPRPEITFHPAQPLAPASAPTLGMDFSSANNTPKHLTIRWDTASSPQKYPFYQMSIEPTLHTQVPLCAYPSWVASDPVTAVRIIFSSPLSRNVHLKVKLR